MKIIKQGDLKRLQGIKHFKCNYCGCEFKADKTEYQYSDLQYTTSYYKCDCPTCGKIVYTEE